jgi:hypothetical protein
MKRLIAFILSLAFVGNVFADVNQSTLTYGNNRNATTTDVTACGWIKSTEDSSSDFLVGKKANITTGAGYSIYQDSSDFLNARVADGTDVAVVTSNNDLDGLWIFGCTEWDNATKTVQLWHTLTAFTVLQSEGTNTNALVGSLSNAVELTVGIDGAAGNGENAVTTATHVYIGKILTEAERNQIQYLPGTVAADSDTAWAFMPLFGMDDPEPTVGGSVLSGDAAAATPANDGPPIMYGHAMPL